MTKKLLIAVPVLAMLCMAPMNVSAHSYDTDDSGHPFQIAGHYVHAVGKGIEYFVTRPVHWIVSQPKTRYVFGHSSQPRKDDMWGDWDLYQRSNQ